ncbi:MAG TPA: hypothetical protein DD473_04925 [Planctomycetaceae bacterium]|nr:hypothetical protein [Planctomycetaceae bacterium]
MNQQTPQTTTMACMEVWGGNSSTSSQFRVPGLDLLVYSQPTGEEDFGGDVYYVSSCASGRITRLILGDVSGHGLEASPTASKLRDIMRRNINHIDQSRLVKAVNEEFESISSSGRFATAIISTYFQPTKSLTICNAGHPNPLIYRASTGLWQSMKEETSAGLSNNMPIGVIEKSEFNSIRLKFVPGDLFLAYTDSLSEAFDSSGKRLNTIGLMELANSIPLTSPSEFLNEFLHQLRSLNPENLSTDDSTIILAQANHETVSLKNNLMAPYRFFKGLMPSRD